MADLKSDSLETAVWWTHLDELELSIATRLPKALDRFLEAKHFLRLVLDLEPCDANLARANWYAGAHMGAIIGIYDAARIDCKSPGVRFDALDVCSEFFLSPDAEDASDRDPVGINRAYREFRNLRTHFGSPLVCLDRRVVFPRELKNPDGACPRWFFVSLGGRGLGELERPLLTQEQRRRFDEYAQHKPFVRVAAHHSYMLGLSLLNSASRLTATGADGA